MSEAGYAVIIFIAGILLGYLVGLNPVVYESLRIERDKIYELLQKQFTEGVDKIRADLKEINEKLDVVIYKVDYDDGKKILDDSRL